MGIRRAVAAGDPRDPGTRRRPEGRPGPGGGPGLTLAASPHIRSVTAADRPALEALLRANSIFAPYEVTVALEVFDASLAMGQADYESAGIETDGVLAGWICWGPTPCTAGTFDMYWIAVDPAAHGSGLGSRLVNEMERRITGRARMVVVETGGRQAYDVTRSFYVARGYEEVARVPDFYAPGDDQVIYVKRFS